MNKIDGHIDEEIRSRSNKDEANDSNTVHPTNIENPITKIEETITISALVEGSTSHNDRDHQNEDMVIHIQKPQHPNREKVGLRKPFPFVNNIDMPDLNHTTTYDILRAVKGGELQLCELYEISNMLLALVDVNKVLTRDERLVKDKIINKINNYKYQFYAILQEPRIREKVLKVLHNMQAIN